MRKIILFMLSLVLVLGLASCASKTQVDLNQVQFKSLFIGTEERLTDDELLSLNKVESDDLIRLFRVKDWTVSSRPSVDLPETLFVLVDQNGLTYSFSKVQGKMLIKIQKKGSSAIVYETIHDVQTVYKFTILPLSVAIKVRDNIATRTFISGNGEVNAYAHSREYPFTDESSDELIEVIKTSEWTLKEYEDVMIGDYEMMVTVSSAIQLYFHATETKASVVVVNNYGTYHRMVFGISLEHYQAIKAKLIELRSTAFEKPSEAIINSVYTQVEYHPWENYPSALKHFSYSITPDQSATAKAAMDYDHWIKLNSTNISADSAYMTLTDTQGFITEITLTTIGPVAIITSTNDASFKEVYGIPDNTIEILYAFSVPWTEAFPAQNVYDFTGTTLSIYEPGPDGFGDYRDILISANDYAEFKDLLEIDTWRLDPFDRYGFGSDPLLYFEDTAGYSLYVYDLFGLTVIGFRKPNYGDSTHYLAPDRIYESLKSFISNHYPKS